MNIPSIAAQAAVNIRTYHGREVVTAVHDEREANDLEAEIFR
jgi:hypothetical protein